MGDTQRQIRVGIGVMVLRDGKLLLGHRCEKGKDTGGIYQPGSWCLPGGKQEFGETMFEGAAREVKEETGLDTGDLYLLGAADSIRADRHYVTLHIVAGTSSGEPKVTEPDKQDEWRWFDLDDLPANLYAPSRLFIDEYLEKTGQPIGSKSAAPCLQSGQIKSSGSSSPS